MNLLAGCLLGLCLFLRAAAAAGPAPIPWLPQESWPGGKQYDARLEKPVRLWVTGAPLAQVFAAVKAQTGVEIGFFPAEDDNARFCVTLYLDPKQPPTLREVMTQLAWVVDCDFGFTGEGEVRTYTLLSTSIGAGALAKWESERNRLTDAREKREEEAALALWQKARARLPELRQALALSREEALWQYRNDPLLLTLLDPARRAIARFVLALSEQQLNDLGPNRGLPLAWGELTAEQRQDVAAAIQPWLSARSAEAAKLYPWPDATETEQYGLDVTCSARPTGMSLDVAPGGGFRDKRMREGGYENAGLPPLTLIADPDWPSGLPPREEVALRRLLGERISAKDEERTEQEASGGKYQNEARQAREHQVAQTRRLSPEAAAKLSATQLPVEMGPVYTPGQRLNLGHPYVLWQIQEAVAARTGFSVISDCTWQPARVLELALFPLGRMASTDALNVLTAMCGSVRDSGAWIGDEYYTAWEWGDAGSLLRFRNLDRAVWREAMWPRQAMDTMNAWLDPSWPASPPPRGDLPEVTVTLDPRRYSPLVAGLGRAQELFGRSLIYADPRDWKEACRRTFRESLLGGLGDTHGCSVISLLDDKQWERLKTEGLVWGKDIVLEPTPLDREFGRWWAYEDGDVLHYEEASSGGRGASFGDPRRARRWGRYYVWREGWDAPNVHPPFEADLPIEVVVQPKRPEHLVEPPSP